MFYRSHLVSITEELASALSIQTDLELAKRQASAERELLTTCSRPQDPLSVNATAVLLQHAQLASTLAAMQYDRIRGVKEASYSWSSRTQMEIANLKQQLLMALGESVEIHHRNEILLATRLVCSR